MVTQLTLLLAQRDGPPDTSLVVLLLIMGLLMLGLLVLALLFYTARVFRRISQPGPNERWPRKTSTFENDWWRKPIVPEVKPTDKPTAVEESDQE